MNQLFIRIAAILAHAVLNFLIVNYTLNFDITGSWLAVGGFVLLIILLLLLFIKHIVSFIQFIKTKTK